MVQADYLFLMTDVDCLYDKNPRTNHDAQAIEVVEDISTLEADVSTAGSSLGTGGMLTKIVAARLATSAGVTTVITRSFNPGNIANIVRYIQGTNQQPSESPSLPTTPTDVVHLSRSISSLYLDGLPKPPPHTRFLPDPHPIRDRSFWILHGLAPHGTLYIDEGAHRALIAKAGLLPVGVVDVEGSFSQQEAVRLVVVKRAVPSSHAETTNGDTHPAYEKGKSQQVEVGKALVVYSAAEIVRIRGLRSSEIQSVLGYADSEYVALRENISLSRREKGSRAGTPSLGAGAENGVVESV